MPLDAPRQQLETWEAFFALLPFVRSDHSTGKRHFWTQKSSTQLDATAPCIEGQHEGLQRGCDWAEQTVHALRTSEKRGVLLRILRDPGLNLPDLRFCNMQTYHQRVLLGQAGIQGVDLKHEGDGVEDDPQAVQGEPLYRLRELDARGPRDPGWGP